MRLVRRGRRAAWLAVLIPALLIVVSAPAWAQKTVGEVRGTVADTSGAVLPGATVTLTNVNTGFTRDVVSDAKGEFVFPVVDPGQYRVDVTMQGFKKYSQLVSVSALQTVQVLPKLAIGGLQEAVEVTAVTRGRQHHERRRHPEPPEGSPGDAEPEPLRVRERHADALHRAVRGAARDDQRVGRREQLEPQRVLHRRRRGDGPLARLVAAAAGRRRLRGDRRQHRRRDRRRRLELRRHVQRHLQVRHQPVPRQRVVLLPRQRPQRELVGQQPRRPRRSPTTR